jgi:hypothetical protein
MKITIPTNQITSGQPLQSFYDDLIKVNSQLLVQTVNGNVVINDSSATVKVVINEDDLLSILAAGGEVEEHLMSIQATATINTTLVPSELPFSKFITGGARQFFQWFMPGSEAWTENAGNGIMFRSNPLAGLVGKEGYLKGSEMKVIKDLDSENYSIKTNAEADAITATGWTKLTW